MLLAPLPSDNVTLLKRAEVIGLPIHKLCKVKLG